MGTDGAVLTEEASVHVIQQPASSGTATPLAPAPSSLLSIYPIIIRATVLFSAFLVGILGALQAGINSACAKHFGGLFLVATVSSFVGGLLCLTVAVVIEQRLSGLSDARCLCWRRWPKSYHLVPGVLGVTFVTLSLSVTRVTGFALFFVLSCIGFLAMGLVIDHRGLFNAPRRAASIGRVIALVVACSGAAMSTASTLSLDSAQPPWLLAICSLLALCAGFLLPMQASINRDAASLLPSKLSASWWSFCGGTLAAVAALGIEVAISGPVSSESGASGAVSSSAWWMYTGGPIGAVYILSGIWGVGVVGVAAYFVALLCGQLAGAAVIDAIGAFGTNVATASPLRGIGIAIVVAAAFGMQLAGEKSFNACCRRLPADTTVTSTASEPLPPEPQLHDEPQLTSTTEANVAVESVDSIRGDIDGHPSPVTHTAESSSLVVPRRWGTRLLL